jgi:hypothetical protein
VFIDSSFLVGHGHLIWQFCSLERGATILQEYF